MGKILAPFKKFLSNKNTITILGVLLGVVVLFLGYRWRVNEAINPTQIFYATRTLIQGDVITAEDIGTTTISKNNLNNMTNVVNEQNDIVGKLVSFDSKIPQNSYFFNESLMDQEEMPDSIFSTIPDGYTIFALHIDNESSFGNSIFPDDTIDIYLHTNSDKDEGKVIYGRFIKQIQVLAVKDGSGNNVFRDRDNVGTPEVLLFSVPEDLYILLSKARYIGMDLVPVARNASYSTNPGEVLVESDFLREYILDKTVILPEQESMFTTGYSSGTGTGTETNN